MRTNYKKAYHDLLKEFKQYQKESIKWCVIDFIDLEDDYDITEEQAQEALVAMINNHDANYGITWDNVGYYKSMYGTKKENNEKIRF